MKKANNKRLIVKEGSVRAVNPIIYETIKELDTLTTQIANDVKEIVDLAQEVFIDETKNKK